MLGYARRNQLRRPLEPRTNRADPLAVPATRARSLVFVNIELQYVLESREDMRLVLDDVHLHRVHTIIEEISRNDARAAEQSNGELATVPLGLEDWDRVEEGQTLVVVHRNAQVHRNAR